MNFTTLYKNRANSSRASPIHSCLQESIIFCLGNIHVYRKALYFVLGTFKYRNGLFNFLCQQTVIIKIQAEMYLPVKCSSFPKSHLCCNRSHSFSWPSSAAPSCCMWKHKMLLLWSNEAVKFQKQYFTSWPSEMKSPLVIFYIAGKP